MLKFKKLKKEGKSTIYEKMCFESQRLEKQIKSLESQLKKFPKGKLAETLALKKYLSLQYEDCIQEKRAIDYYLKHHKESKADNMLMDSPAYQELLSNNYKLLSEEIIDWMNSPYETNKKYLEQCIYKGPSGKLVRSKSEAVKLQTYIENGIVPSINLITTYETKEEPFDYEKAEKVVQDLLAII